MSAPVRLSVVGGAAGGGSLATILPLAALDMALTQRRLTGRLLHHSDHGKFNAPAKITGSGWRKSGAVPSNGNYYDNATMESFWSSLKGALVYRRKFSAWVEARAAIF